MKVPAYIDEALRRRTKAIKQFKKNDFIISEYIEKNGLERDIEPKDYHCGVETIIHPEQSEKRIRIAIASKRKING